ncbi:MAG: VWA domain-containing protein [Deltaproteobacteria bacterium]|nr:VWA domain-containing protein [Deltaproteobacteria bacterium]
MSFQFANAWALVFLALPLLVLWWRIAGERFHTAHIRVGGAELWRDVRPSWRVRFRRLPLYLRVATLVFVVFALARPQLGRTQNVTEGEGIDIVLTLDVSGSMAAQDFAPNDRLFVAKQTIERFIEGRKVDRIGLVLFAGQAFSQSPLTLDYGIILQFLDRAKIGMIEDGTAIGMALVTATNRLRESTAKSKVVVLLTDGDNNAGRVDPMTAADLAKAVGIRVHTIGVGSDGPAYIPVKDPLMGTRLVKQNFVLDEKVLRGIADKTGGQFYRATDADSLRRVFDAIDQLEKSPYEVKTFTDFTERYPLPLALAFLCLAAELLLARTALREVC